MHKVIFKLLVAFLGITHPDETCLKNVKQLTSPDRGFEKAGEAYFSPDGTKISFQGVPTGESDYQIYVMDLQSGQISRISEGKGACTCSYFRQDGKKMIFASSQVPSKQYKGQYKWDLTPFMNIYESNLDGSEKVALTSGEAYHAECGYSPDGKSIVYASNEDGSMNLYTMDADGTHVKQLTHTKGCYNGGPFYSPDGEEIIFRADREVPDLLQIYVMNKDGSNVRKLTDNGAVNWAPFWHPTKPLIAYTTSIHGHHNYEIYLLSTKTGSHYRVTHHPAFDGLPTFNREGTKMLWTSKRGSDNTSQIFIADFISPEE